MRVSYLTQPHEQLGIHLTKLLTSPPRPTQVVFVSAFVSLQTILRVKPLLLNLQENAVDVRLVLGTDLGGTSRETLQELLTWPTRVHLVRHRHPYHTFHPKIYLIERPSSGTIIVGSNNLTEGGLFRNYEGAVKVDYDLPADRKDYAVARESLQRFLDPSGPTTAPLTIDLLHTLVARGEIPSETEARNCRNRSPTPLTNTDAPPSPFGIEDIALPPPMLADVLGPLIRTIPSRTARTSASPAQPSLPSVPPAPADVFSPAAFYMTLPTLQGHSIPGEARIPLLALEMAPEFWGWRREYRKDQSPRRDSNRVYWNWRPLWRIWSVENPTHVKDQVVRMYMYENSSDFRFYAKPLVNAGADQGDLVRIRRISDDNGVEYECVLARKTTPEFADWLSYCTQSVRNSNRSFGYA